MVWGWVVQLAWLAVSYLVSYYTAPKPPNARPNAITDFEFPIVEEGTSVAWDFGTVWCTGPMVLFFGGLRQVPIKVSTK